MVAKPKVFGIGLPRTGTTSLSHALEELGYATIHCPSDAATRSEIYRYFDSNSDAINLSVLETHDALADIPVCCIYRGLERSYPDSRFIFTVRDKDSWMDSCQRLWETFLLPVIVESPDSVEATYLSFLWDRLLGKPITRAATPSSGAALSERSTRIDREILSDLYDDYHAGVQQYFKDKPDKLLTLNIICGEGWARLAPFLGEPVLDIPFPSEMKLNTADSNESRATGQGTRPQDAESRGELAMAYLDAFRKHDLAACLNFFADDAVLRFYDHRFRGRIGVEEWHQQRFSAGADIVKIHRTETANDAVTIDLTAGSQILKRLRVKFRSKVVVRFAGDKITELSFEGGRFLR